MINKELYGQFFTPEAIAKEMVDLIENNGSILEPSCGAGVFLELLPSAIGIEIDATIAHKRAKIMNFFDLKDNIKYDTIIGNPPYIKYQNIDSNTKSKLPQKFDSRTNLYIFFIDKCIDLLNPGGELIFITPRDFIKATYALNLNDRLFKEGGFTFWKEFGDTQIFPDASPNVVIFRWVKNKPHTIPVEYYNGYLTINVKNQANKKKIFLNEIFDILVGGASGLNSVFIEQSGNIDLVVSDTKRTGLTKKAHYYTKPNEYMLQHKNELMQRKIKHFTESNWWEWGRAIRHIDKEKIYVNNKTRDMKPFFTNPSGWFDGSILALVPKNINIPVNELIDILNDTDWEAQGFLVGGRLIFGQRSLSNAYILINENIEVYNAE